MDAGGVYKSVSRAKDAEGNYKSSVDGDDEGGYKSVPPAKDAEGVYKPVPPISRPTDPVVRARFPDQKGLRTPHRAYRQCQYA